MGYAPYVKKYIDFEYQRNFEKVLELLTSHNLKFERLMCEVEFWEVLEKRCESFLEMVCFRSICWLPISWPRAYGAPIAWASRWSFRSESNKSAYGELFPLFPIHCWD